MKIHLTVKVVRNRILICIFELSHWCVFALSKFSMGKLGICLEDFQHFGVIKFTCANKENKTLPGFFFRLVDWL